MKKRILSFLLVLAMRCTLLPQTVLFAHAEPASGTCGDNLTWSFDAETGALTIEGSGEMGTFYNSDDVPWDLYRDSIKSVSLPEGLTSIGDWAFYELLQSCPVGSRK